MVAADGQELSIELFDPPGAPVATAIIAPALGVPRKVYSRLAAYLAEAGILTLTLDYRGIGASRPRSLKGFKATFADWGELDLKAAVAELGKRAPAVPLLWIGHSAGGQLMGLLPDAPIKAALFLASGSAFWGHYPGAMRLKLGVLWYLTIPLLSPLFGYYPMSRIGGGEDLPRGVAEQWAQWGRHPDYIGSYQRERSGSPSYAYTGPLRSYCFTDDDYAPEKAVRALLQLYPGSRPEVIVRRPADLGQGRVGHFGAFRPALQESLWREARDWLLARSS